MFYVLTIILLSPNIDTLFCLLTNDWQYPVFFFLQKYESIEVCEKNVFQVDLVKSQNETEFGFAVEAELAQSFERDDELRLYVSNVLPASVAIQAGGS